MDRIRCNFQQYVAMTDNLTPGQDDFMIRWVLLGSPFHKFSRILRFTVDVIIPSVYSLYLLGCSRNGKDVFVMLQL
jgi:hypothetical protein